MSGRARILKPGGRVACKTVLPTLSFKHLAGNLRRFSKGSREISWISSAAFRFEITGSNNNDRDFACKITRAGEIERVKVCEVSMAAGMNDDGANTNYTTYLSCRQLSIRGRTIRYAHADRNELHENNLSMDAICHEGTVKKISSQMVKQ
jgi:hypothetical protein